MLRTVWLAIACLIALAGLTIIKVGTASVVQEAALTSDQTTGANLADAPAPDVLPKGDRLDAADEDDAIKPVRPIAILPRVAEALPVGAETSESAEPERTWRSSYAKREASGKRHRKGKFHKTSRRHHSSHASRKHKGRSKR
jgi:hypothetical protein